MHDPMAMGNPHAVSRGAIQGSRCRGRLAGWSLALAGILALTTQGASAAGRGQVKLGPEVEVSRAEDYAHVETMLAVNPAQAEEMLASCIALPRRANGKFQFRSRPYFSGDGGQTWQACPLPEATQWDPVVTFGATGTLIVACLIGDRVQIYRSEDKGRTWLGPKKLGEGDHERLVVDRGRGLHGGNVYVAAANDDGEIVVDRSADDARTFQAVRAASGFKNGFVDGLLVLREGTVVVAARSEMRKNSDQLSVLISTNGCRSFLSPWPIAARRFAGRGHPGNNEPAYAAGVFGGHERIFGVFGGCEGDENARLALVHSDDQGRTWSLPVRVVAGVPAEVTHGQANVMINRNGVVGVSFLARTIGPTAPRRFKEGEEVVFDFNESYDLYFAASLDGGETFLPPVRVSEKSSRPESRHASRFMPGMDYMLGDVSPDGAFHLLWPDARSGVFQLYARRVTVE